MNTKIPHTRILASAGSGKTFQLTNRYILLMGAGVDPERILALTFTRKAAGEFFDSILTKLAEAAQSPEKGKLLSKSLGVEKEAPDWNQLLIKLLSRMGALRMGTLDGFFHEILSAFSAEFGLGPGFTLMDEAESAYQRNRLYRELFRREGIHLNERRRFIEAFRQATFGEEKKSLLGSLQNYIDKQHTHYILEPNPNKWGNRRCIWPENGGPWKTKIDRAAAVGKLKEVLEPQLLEGSMARKYWWGFLENAERWEPGMNLPSETLMDKIREVRNDLAQGYAQIQYSRKTVTLKGDPARLLIGLADTIYHLELERRLARTRGVRSVVAAYESLYSKLVRNRGNLSFSDIQILLARLNLQEKPRLTQGISPISEEAFLDIHFRLDGRFDHWLLDEFQDTSRIQWKILQDLIDEVVMDPGGERTFFFVGDVKQAIYNWRGGDASLFERVSNYYKTAAPESPFEERRLQKSWRSGPSIISLVNQVFGKTDVLYSIFQRTPRAVEDWFKNWDEHTTAHPDRTDFACHLKTGGDLSRPEAVHSLLTRIRPHEKNLSCCILLQTNQHVSRWVEDLRNPGELPILEDRTVPVAADNPLGASLAALVRAAAHPGDSFSNEWLLMTPFGQCISKWGWNFSHLSRHFHRLLAAEGFSGVFEFWLQNIHWKDRLDPFNRLRAGQILDAAAQFDAGGSRDPDAFLLFLKGYQVGAGESTGNIRVMTIHQSKGLGFDLVILPELERRGPLTLDKPRDDIGIFRDSSANPQWILELPKTKICEADPTLAALRKSQRNEAAMESLCLFYVALTRAKQGLYLLTDKSTRNNKTPDFVSWLDKSLVDTDKSFPPVIEKPGLETCWMRGDPNWYEKASIEISAPPKKIPEIPPFPGKPETLETINPSQADNFKKPVSSFQSTGSVSTGTWVHRAFEQVEWDDENTEMLLNTWVNRQRNDLRPLAQFSVERVMDCLNNPDIRHFFDRNRFHEPQLYREQAFDWISNGKRITGQWDRLILIPQKKAILIDFKAGNEKEGRDQDAVIQRYVPQVNLYRKAVSAAYNLPLNSIEAYLVFYNASTIHQL